MKKFIIIFLFTTVSYAQARITFAIDPKMAIKGAYEYSTKSALDIQLKLSDKNYHNETGIQLEFVHALQPSYFSYGLFSNYIITLNTSEIYAGIEGNLIMRKINRSTAGFLSVGANTGYRLNFNRFAIGLEANYKTRPDFKALWNSTKIGTFSGYITFTYKFKKL